MTATEIRQMLEFVTLYLRKGAVSDGAAYVFDKYLYRQFSQIKALDASDGLGPLYTESCGEESAEELTDPIVGETISEECRGRDDHGRAGRGYGRCRTTQQRGTR